MTKHQNPPPDPSPPTPPKTPTAPKSSPPSFKKGGKVQKSGFAKVHKGEKVLTVKQQKKRGGK